MYSMCKKEIQPSDENAIDSYNPEPAVKESDNSTPPNVDLGVTGDELTMFLTGFKTQQARKRRDNLLSAAVLHH